MAADSERDAVTPASSSNEQSQIQVWAFLRIMFDELLSALECDMPLGG
uniref:Uncharacterized protein n=1 Tax=Ascaris lumbricoides TaxID=6252 RepID=A0A0M3IMC7_ASCLU